MFIAMRKLVLRVEDRRTRRHVAGDTVMETSHMIWETPVAIDFRFGMEITMYVSNR